MKKCKTRKLLSVMLTMGMILLLTVIPQTVSADTEYVEQLIYSQDFSNVTENVDYVLDSYDNANGAGTVVPGTWYIGAGGRIMSHDLAYGAFVKGGWLKRTYVPYMFPQSFDNTQNEYTVSFKFKNYSGKTRIFLVKSAGGTKDIDVTSWGTAPTYYDVKLTINGTSCQVERNGSYLKTVDLGETTKLAGITLFLNDNNSSLATAYAWIDDVVIKQGETEIVNETFDNWQRDDINNQLTAVADYISEVYQDTTPSLYALSGGSDKVVATQWHTTGTGTGEWITFVFPEVMSSGKYKITYDYLAAGNWCDYLYLYTSSAYSQVNINATQSNWVAAQVDIDIDNNTWSYNGYTPDTAGIVDDTTDRMVFRMHQNAANGVELLIDNVKIYKLVSSSGSELDKNTFSVTSCAFTDSSDNVISAPQAGTVNAEVVLGINTRGNYSFAAIIAAYTADGVLQNTSLGSVDVSSSESTKTIDLSIAADANTASCKVFLWDMSDGVCIPLSETINLPE